MNTTGCPPNFANDGFFLMGQPLAVPCTIPIPFYAVFVSIAAVIYAFVAFSRTRLILKRVQQTQKKSHRGRFSWIQLSTIVLSWSSFLICLAILIVPLTFGDSKNVMVFLLGFQMVPFELFALKWANKLIRLGLRIIDPKKKQTDSNEGGSSDDQLNRLDFVQKFLSVSIHLTMVFQIICLCVLAMVYPTQRVWLHLGIGMLALFVLLGVTLNVYQYQRCKNAVLAMNARIQNNIVEKEVATLSAVRKFTKHQIIQILAGLPSAVIILLWGINVIPLTYGFILFALCADGSVNGLMFVTFLGGSKRRKGNAAPSGETAGEAQLSSKVNTFNE